MKKKNRRHFLVSYSYVFGSWVQEFEDYPNNKILLEIIELEHPSASEIIVLAICEMSEEDYNHYIK